ncbi:MAG TPA: class I SAM-dependent methyltransferase [Roseiarcus sp.]|nr:class I SAM-dependent methyltransferase [Roseiarcus sp.]
MASIEDQGLAAAQARTRASYDATPYPSAPMQRSHPGRLAAQAVWRGLRAPDAARARVLEIGCASGGNLLALAAALPKARLLGVDLSPAQIAAGEARRQRCGLDNVELRAASFEAIDDGEFDFIICHGVYSWIPEPLREALLRVVKARLAPDGLAMVSFNVLPGWRLMQIARDSMLLNARLIDDPAERAEKTRQLFGLLATQSSDKRSYGKFWRNEAQRMAAGGDAYLAHEIFEEANAPETFADFAARAASHGLAYLGESVAVANNEADLAPEGAETIRALAGGDRLKAETYIDIFSGRSFREALLIHAGRAPAPTPQLGSLHAIPALDFEIADEDGDAFRLSIKDTELVIRNSGAAPAMRRLVARRPASCAVADLGEVDEALRIAVENGLVAVSTLPVVCAVKLAERPRIWPFAAMEALASDRAVTLRHSAFQFAPLQRFLAPLLDGTLTRDDLIAAAMEQSRSGALTVSGPDGPIADPAEIDRRLAAGVDSALAGLLRNGLLVEG